MSVNLTIAASTTNATMTACAKKVSKKNIFLLGQGGVSWPYWQKYMTENGFSFLNTDWDLVLEEQIMKVKVNSLDLCVLVGYNSELS